MRDKKVLEISPTMLWSQRRSQAGRMEKMEKAVLAAFLSHPFDGVTAARLVGDIETSPNRSPAEEAAVGPPA